MKKISFGLLLTTASCAFSFNKTSDRILFAFDSKCILPPIGNPIIDSQRELIQINSINISRDKKNLHDRKKTDCSVNNQFKYFLLDPDAYIDKINYKVSDNLQYLDDPKMTPLIIGLRGSYQITAIDFRYIEPKPTMEHAINYWHNELGDIDKYNPNFTISESKIRVNNSREAVKLISPENKSINFKDSLLNYMQSYKQRQDRELFQHTVKFVDDVQSSRPIDSISKIRNIDKITYTENQIKLLENSEILRIWALPSTTYNNHQYVEDWNQRHPEEPKQPESKTINNIIIGFAYNKEKCEIYNWIVDLGPSQDISVLFNYPE